MSFANGFANGSKTTGLTRPCFPRSPSDAEPCRTAPIATTGAERNRHDRSGAEPRGAAPAASNRAQPEAPALGWASAYLHPPIRTGRVPLAHRSAPHERVMQLLCVVVATLLLTGCTSRRVSAPPEPVAASSSSAVVESSSATEPLVDPEAETTHEVSDRSPEAGNTDGGGEGRWPAGLGVVGAAEDRERVAAGESHHHHELPERPTAVEPPRDHRDPTEVATYVALLWANYSPDLAPWRETAADWVTPELVASPGTSLTDQSPSRWARGDVLSVQTTEALDHAHVEFTIERLLVEDEHVELRILVLAATALRDNDKWRVAWLELS